MGHTIYNLEFLEKMTKLAATLEMANHFQKNYSIFITFGKNKMTSQLVLRYKLKNSYCKR